MEPTSIVSRRIYGLLILLCGGGLVWLFISRVPVAPDDTVLQGAHLPALLSAEVGAGWPRFFKRSLLLGKEPLGAAQVAALKQIDRGAWLVASTSFKRDLRALQPKLLQLWLMWPRQGCYRARVVWEKPPGTRPMRSIYRALQLARLAIVWQLQGPQPKRGQAMLRDLRGRLRKLIAACPLARGEFLIWLKGLRQLDQLHDYVRAVPTVGGDTQATQARIIRWWTTHQKRVRAALQWDHRALHDAIVQQRKEGNAWWRRYWVDPLATRALHLHWLRGMVRHSMNQEPHTSPWTISPLETMLQEERARSSWVAFFEKNAIGMEFLAQALPLHRGRALLASWHKHRCVLAAHALRWPFKPGSGKPSFPLQDPFTGKPLSTQAGAAICGLPAPFGLGLSPSLRKTTQLPALPTQR